MDFKNNNFMKIIIRTKNLEFTDQMKGFIDKKIGALAKFLKVFQHSELSIAHGKDLFETFVEIKKETDHHKKGYIFKAEAKIYVPGKTFFAERRGDNLLKIIDDVRDELEMEIKRYKTKIIEFSRRKAKKSKHKI